MTNIIDINEIELEEKILYGNFGQVNKAKWQNKQIVAKASSIPVRQIDLEPLFDIKHKNIVQIYGTADDYYLMEYADCGSLHDFLHDDKQREYTVKDGLRWMHQVALGLAYLSQLNPREMYWDLNIKTLMLADNFRSIKIAGFREVHNRLSFPPNGYTSPEAILGEDDSSGKCDVYCLGINLWEVLTRKKPFYHTVYTSLTLGDAIIRGERPLLSELNFLDCDPIKTLIENCWNSNPKERDEAGKVVIALFNICFRDCRAFYLEFVLRADIGAIVDLKDIQICEKIGEGDFGVVYRATWFDKDIAVKKFKHFFKESKSFQNQVRKILTTEKFCQFYYSLVFIHGIFIDKQSIYLLSEYSECGSLSNYLHGVEQREYSVAQAINWMCQAVQSFKILISMKAMLPFVNKNVKPQNLLFFENFTRLKISDYCSPINRYNLEEHNTDIAYIAPERFRGKKLIGKSVVYSFGIIFWEVMSRKKPLADQLDWNLHMNMFRIINGLRPHLGDIKGSRCNSIDEIISNCWADDPKERPSIDELWKQLTDLDLSDESSDEVLSTEPAGDFIIVAEPHITPTVVLKDINISKPVGKGSFGIVYRASWRGKDIALKKCFGVCISLDDTAMKNFEKEVKQLSSVDHENIVQLYGITFDNESAYLLMEFAECGSLSKLLHGKDQRPYTMVDAIYWMIQCVNGIQHLHAIKPKPLLHRDLKPDNLLLTDNFRTLKIGDFGTVTELSTLMTKDCGTPDYIAPEVVLGNRYTEKCDIFSFGIILWEVMSRKKPFRHMVNPNKDAIKYSILKGDRPQLSDITVPNCSQLIEMIQICWEHNPDMRPSVGTIKLCDIPCTHNQIKSHS